MSRKRVVVTGLSALTPLGGNVTESWDNLLAGKSGIGPITLFDASGFDSRIAGEVKGFNPEAYGVPAKQARRMDRFVQFAVAAGNMLMEQSSLHYGGVPSAVPFPMLLTPPFGRPEASPHAPRARQCCAPVWTGFHGGGSFPARFLLCSLQETAMRNSVGAAGCRFAKEYT